MVNFNGIHIATQNCLTIVNQKLEEYLGFKPALLKGAIIISILSLAVIRTFPYVFPHRDDHYPLSRIRVGIRQIYDRWLIDKPKLRRLLNVIVPNNLHIGVFVLSIVDLQIPNSNPNVNIISIAERICLVLSICVISQLARHIIRDLLSDFLRPRQENPSIVVRWLRALAPNDL